MIANATSKEVNEFLDASVLRSGNPDKANRAYLICLSPSRSKLRRSKRPLQERPSLTIQHPHHSIPLDPTRLDSTRLTSRSNHDESGSRLSSYNIIIFLVRLPSRFLCLPSRPLSFLASYHSQARIFDLNLAVALVEDTQVFNHYRHSRSPGYSVELCEYLDPF